MIRPDQLALLEASVWQRFVRETCADLALRFPDSLGVVALEPAELEERVSVGLRRAQGYGIERRSDLRFFAECMVMLGTGFDSDPERPYLREVLNDAWLDGEQKMDRISDHLLFREGI